MPLEYNEFSSPHVLHRRRRAVKEKKEITKTTTQKKWLIEIYVAHFEDTARSTLSIFGINRIASSSSSSSCVHVRAADSLAARLQCIFVFVFY